jgi:two-component system sensor histidine kinase VicK
MGDLSISSKNSNDMIESKTKQKESESVLNITLPQCILNNVYAFVGQQQNIFELMWQKAIPAEQRIREIEFGIKPEVIETIKDKEEIQNLLFSLLESSNEEILVIFSISNEFHRQEASGFFKVIKKVQQARSWIRVSILTPKDNEIESIKDKDEKGATFVFNLPLKR